MYVVFFSWFRFFLTIHCNLTAHHNDDIFRRNSTYSRFLAHILSCFFFLSRFFSLCFFFSFVIVESVQDERTTDSSVGWLNCNKSGRTYTAKCRCMEEKKEKEEESFWSCYNDKPRKKKKEHDREKKRKKERIESRLFGGFISVFLSLLDGDSSYWLLLPSSFTSKDLFVFEFSLSTLHANNQAIL